MKQINQWTMDNSIDNGEWTMDNSIDNGEWTMYNSIDNGEWTMDNSIDNGEWIIDNCRRNRLENVGTHHGASARQPMPEQTTPISRRDVPLARPMGTGDSIDKGQGGFHRTRRGHVPTTGNLSFVLGSGDPDRGGRTMVRPYNWLLIFILTLISTACHNVEEYADDAMGNFEALWTIIDQHYCFFEQKDIDWNVVHDKYARRIGNEMTREELFTVCSDMLDELRDGHVNLTSPFNTSYYRKWWSDYPQNFSKRLIEESYFNFNYRQSSGMMYGLLSENIGYIYYGSFSSPVGEGNLDNVLYYLSSAQALIIDVRDNGGGNLTNVEKLVARFITEPTLVGYISHKTGPGHSDFSEPTAITYNPADIGRQRWGKPIVVLANRSTFSAANNFVSIMKLLPGVKIVGATTGGGSGVPFSSEIPCGWAVRFSACSMLDADGVSTEQGVTPSPGCAIDLSTTDILAGRDTILDFAIQIIQDN